MTQTIRKIPLGRPVFDDQEQAAVDQVLNSPWMINGPQVRGFEEEFKNNVGAPYASAVSSCTAAMHLALSGLNIGEGDEVILPGFNFIAAGLSVLQAGARPVFTDVDQETGNLCFKDLEKKITSKTKGVLLLHYAGYPADLENILKVTGGAKVPVIEDAAHALGAGFAGAKLGSHTAATCFSFGPLKMICSSMGGMVTSKDENLIRRINALRSYGMDKSMWDRQEDQMPWSYSIAMLGHNFRMTDIQAALGKVQLKKLDQFISQRNLLADRYDKKLKKLPFVEFFKTLDAAQPVRLYYAIKIRYQNQAGLRDKLAVQLINQGIGVSVHWDPPLHQHPLFKTFAPAEGSLPASESLAKCVISLPLHPAMTEDDVDYICALIEKIAEKEIS